MQSVEGRTNGGNGRNDMLFTIKAERMFEEIANVGREDTWKRNTGESNVRILPSTNSIVSEDVSKPLSETDPLHESNNLDEEKQGSNENKKPSTGLKPEAALATTLLLNRPKRKRPCVLQERRVASGASAMRKLNLSTYSATTSGEQDMPLRKKSFRSKHSSPTQTSGSTDRSHNTSRSYRRSRTIVVRSPENVKRKNVIVTTPLSSVRRESEQSGLLDIGLFNCEKDVEYNSGVVLGEGTDGKVELVTIHGRRIALKTSKSSLKRSSIELKFLRDVRYKRGFVQCLGACSGYDHRCIALEVMDGKLSNYQRKHIGANKPFPKPLATHILMEVCSAMNVLHEEIGIAHGDLAFRNILVKMSKEQDMIVKLSDFGRVCLEEDEPKNIFDATSGFKYRRNCDVGAFGRDVLFRLITGEIVPEKYVQETNRHGVKYCTVVNLNGDLDKKLGDFKGLFYRCVRCGVRPSFREILENLTNNDYWESTENDPLPVLKLPHLVSPQLGNSRQKTLSFTNSLSIPRTIRRKKVAEPSSKSWGASKRSRDICAMITGKKGN